MDSIRLSKNDIELRALHQDDAPELARLANDKSIFDMVRDYFPHPYSINDAIAFISGKQGLHPVTTFGIMYQGKLAGMVDIKIQTDVYRKSGEVGYWIGAPYRGLGIASDAVSLVTEYGFRTLDINRLFAGVYSTNHGSMRVLEKCGYLFEGISRQAIWKNGQFLDLHRYGFVKELGY